jgi:hypothetical protein
MDRRPATKLPDTETKKPATVTGAGFFSNKAGESQEALLKDLWRPG